MKFLDREAPQRAYITLMADVPKFYSKFGFKLRGLEQTKIPLLDPDLS